MNRLEEDPSSENLVDARRDTFRDWWPHEAKKGWRCKTEKMINAGWCFSPLPDAEDCVTCFYCGISLDGWEPKDDPWHEHRKRAPDCHFFTLMEESAQLKKATKAKKGKSTRTSRSTRHSTQSTATADLDVSTIPTEDEPATEEGDSLMSTASTASKARSKKKATKSKAPGRKTKKTAKTASEAVNDSVLSHQIEMELERDLTEQEPNPEPEVKQYEESQEPIKPTRATKRGKKNCASDDGADPQSITEPEPPKSKPTRGTRKGQKKKSDNEVENSQEVDQVRDVVETSAMPPHKPTRGKKRLSDGSEKIDSSVVVMVPEVNDENDGAADPVEAVEPKQKPKRIRKEDSSPKGDGESKQSKPKKNAKGKKRQQSEPEPEPEPEPAFEGDQHVESTSEPSEELERLQVREDDDYQSPEFSPQPAQQRSPPPESQVAEDVEMQEPTQPDTEMADEDTSDKEPQQQATPPPASPRHTPTPQSSDAENQPPSSRPASLKPNKTQNPPQLSPSKRNMVTVSPHRNDNKQSWYPIDVEYAFMNTPKYDGLGDEAGFDMESVIRDIKSPEKNLTVEEWIKKNAVEAEGRLRQECEQMISKFEGEGNRALEALEAVEVS